MDAPPPSNGQETASLITLPLELKKQILPYLVHDWRPNLAVLRRTHTSFLNLIPKSSLRSEPSHEELLSQLTEAWIYHPYLFPVGHWPCQLCARVLETLSCLSGSDWRILKGIGDEPEEHIGVCKDCSKTSRDLLVSAKGYVHVTYTKSKRHWNSAWRVDEPSGVSSVGADATIENTFEMENDVANES